MKTYTEMASDYCRMADRAREQAVDPATPAWRDYLLADAAFLEQMAVAHTAMSRALELELAADALRSKVLP